VRRVSKDDDKAVCEIIFGPPGHRVKGHAIAWLEGGVVRYRPVDIANCHDGCGHQVRDMWELMQILGKDKFQKNFDILRG